jgi:uncharacterized protein YggE
MDKPSDKKFTLASRCLFWSLLNLILVVLLVFGVRAMVLGSTLLPIQRTVSVSAEGKVSVAPDIATVVFSVVSEGKDPKVVQGENTEKMNTAIAFVKSQGVEEKDIKTSGYNLYPQYDYGNGKIFPAKAPTIVGYSLTQTVTVKVRDLEKVGDILGGLPGAGVNQIQGTSFDIDDPDAYLAEARAQAFEKARQKARAMAAANGARIGRVVTFNESTGGWPIYFSKAELAADGRGGASMPAPAVEPGSQDVMVSVSVIYEVK